MRFEQALRIEGKDSRDRRNFLIQLSKVARASNETVERGASDTMFRATVKQAGSRLTPKKETSDTAGIIASCSVNVTPQATQNYSVTSVGKRRQNAKEGGKARSK